MKRRKVDMLRHYRYLADRIFHGRNADRARALSRAYRRNSADGAMTAISTDPLSVANCPRELRNDIN